MTTLAERSQGEQHSIMKPESQEAPVSVVVFSSPALTEKPQDVVNSSQQLPAERPEPLSTRQFSRYSFAVEGGYFRQKKPTKKQPTKWIQVPEKPGEKSYTPGGWNPDCWDGEGTLWTQVPEGKRHPRRLPRLPERRPRRRRGG